MLKFWPWEELIQLCFEKDTNLEMKFQSAQQILQMVSFFQVNITKDGVKWE